MSETPTGSDHSEPQSSRPTRPAYLAVVLIVAWFLGLGTLQEGYLIARIVSNPLAGDTLELPEGLREALVDAVGLYSSTALPGAVAQILLGGLLVVVSAATLFGSRLPSSFTLQVLFANAAAAIVLYFLSEPLREAVIVALVQSPELQSAPFNEVDPAEVGVIYQWGYRIKLLLHVAALGLTALALTRPRVRQFLAYVSQPREEN